MIPWISFCGFVEHFKKVVNWNLFLHHLDDHGTNFCKSFWEVPLLSWKGLAWKMGFGFGHHIGDSWYWQPKPQAVQPWKFRKSKIFFAFCTSQQTQRQSSMRFPGWLKYEIHWTKFICPARDTLWSGSNSCACSSVCSGHAGVTLSFVRSTKVRNH